MKEENQTIIKAINMFGRVPEQYELLEEIERLNNIIKEQGLEDKPNYYVKGLEGSLKEYQEEIKRLNNIINDFEKYLIEEIEDYEKQIKYHKKNKDLRSGILDLVGEYEGEKVCFEDMLGKLQELKGSDK